MPVPIEIEGQVYLTQREARKYLGIARETFVKNVEPHLRVYRDDLHPSQILFLQSDLDQFKENRFKPRTDQQF